MYQVDPPLVRIAREVRLKVGRSVHLAASLLLCILAISHAQEPPPIGVLVPPLGAGPWVFDTAEQHEIVSVS